MFLQAPILILPQGQFTPLEEITLPGLINAAVNIILIVASILFVFSILAGGIKMISSGGKSDRMDEAKRQLINAFIGIFIVFCIYAVMNFISTFYGIDLLTFQIPAI